MQLFTDKPVSSKAEDDFGFAPYADVLCDTILQTPTRSLPFCIGIFGPWGSGKSSFMKMLQVMIEEQAGKPAQESPVHDEQPGQGAAGGKILMTWFRKSGKLIGQEAKHVKVQTIWFNPWKYDKKEDLWNALIQTILDEIIKGSKNKEVLRKAQKLALAATWLTLKKAVSVLTKGMIDASNLDEIVKSFSKKDEKYYRHINEFETDFADVVKMYVNCDKDVKDDKNNKSGRLVIFIDDLDRCLPENAITVLESLKLFIGDAHCIFVLGIDHQIVEEGIKQRYGGNARIDIDGREYLDKIIQVPLFLPRVSSERLKESLLAKKVSQTLSKRIEMIWDIIEKGTGGNPRKMKRFVNSFYLLQQFLDHPDSALQKSLQKDSLSPLPQEKQDTYLAKLLVFEISFPEFYQYLLHHPDDWEFLEQYILPAKENRKQSFANNGDKQELAKLWEDNISFQTFMLETRVGAPEGKVVRRLLQATNLVAETSST